MILGALLGLAGSIIPELLKLYKDKQDKKHELEMLKLQLEKEKVITELRVQESVATAQIELDKEVYRFARPDITPTGFRFADTLQALGSFLNTLVRPLITSIAVFIWLTYRLKHGDWSPIDTEIIWCIITFWFGGRAFLRAYKK